MWRPNEPVEEDGSNLVGIDPQSKRRRSRRRAWRDGLVDQTVVKTLEDVRSYRAFERALIGSIVPRSVIELALAHRLASLLWRLRRACAIETGLFEIQGELLSARRQDPSRGPSQPGALPTATGANGHSKALVRTDVRIGRPETKNCCRRLCVRHSDHPAPSPNVSCASLMSTRPYFTAWAATKRGYGVKRRKPSGPLKKSDGRHRLRRGGGFGNRQGFLIGMPSTETEMRPPGYRLSK
jgi:hypothetical protein